MGRKRKRDKWSNDDYFWFALIFPIAVVCAYPILLVPIIIVVVLWITASIIKLVKKIKANKIVKKLQKEYSLKAVVERANKENSSVVKKDISKNDTNDNTNSFNEILSICNDIEDKLLELDIAYFDLDEDNVELNSLFLELEGYDKIIRNFRNKKLVDLNDELLKEARECHERFLGLYDEFNLLIDENETDSSDEENAEEDDISDTLVAGAVGYSLYKKREEEKEEKEREAYREELRNVWGLTEYQIGLVESGEYEPCQFSEEELEEDDYYSEDD